MSNGKEFILSTNHLSKEFYENGRTLVACHDINIQVEKGKTLAIVGESGCGKSTLVKMLMGMVDKSSGEIYLDGEDMAFFDKRKWRDTYQKMQMIFQNPQASFHPRQKVIDILTEPLRNLSLIHI